MTTFTAGDYQVLDPGVYTATFDRTEDLLEPGPYGFYTDWFFIVTTEDGPVEVSGRSSKPERLTRSTKARQWLEALLGRPLAKDETVDTTTLEGTRVMLTLDVKVTEVGDFNRVVGIRRVDAAQPSIQQQAARSNVDPEYAAWLAEREAQAAAVEAANAEEPPPPTEAHGDLEADDQA